MQFPSFLLSVELQLMYLLNNYFLYVELLSINCSFQPSETFPSEAINLQQTKNVVERKTFLDLNFHRNLICKHIFHLFALSLCSASALHLAKVIKLLNLGGVYEGREVFGGD